MFCTKCGQQNQEDAVFCSSCNTRFITQNAYQEPQGNNQAFSQIPSVTLNSMPPVTINPASIVMYKVEGARIIIKMDGEWGDKTLSYMDPQEMYGDCNKLFVALQQLTNNKVMQFKSEGGPVVPLYRITKINSSDWWGPPRIEIDFAGAGGEWFQYSNKGVRDADHVALMNFMRSGYQQ